VTALVKEIKKEEHQLDPGRRGLMVYPLVEIANLRIIINGLHAWVRLRLLLLCSGLASLIQKRFWTSWDSSEAMLRSSDSPTPPLRTSNAWRWLVACMVSVMTRRCGLGIPR
jgi:hypothetical protein